MKRLIAVLILCLLLPACSKSCVQFANTVDSAADMVCQATPEQKETAAKMLLALDAAQPVGATFFPVLGIAKASAVLQAIITTGCFIVAELEQAFMAVDAANIAVAQKQVKMLKGSASITPPEYPALRKYLKK